MDNFTVQSIVNDSRVTPYPTLEVRTGANSWYFVDHHENQDLMVDNRMVTFQSFPFTYIYSKKSAEATSISAEIRIQAVSMIPLVQVLNRVVLSNEPVLMIFREYLSINPRAAYNVSMHEMLSVRTGLTEATIQCSLYFFNSGSFPPFRATSDAFPFLLS